MLPVKVTALSCAETSTTNAAATIETAANEVIILRIVLVPFVLLELLRTFMPVSRPGFVGKKEQLIEPAALLD